MNSQITLYDYAHPKNKVQIYIMDIKDKQNDDCFKWSLDFIQRHVHSVETKVYEILITRVYSNIPHSAGGSENILAENV